MISHLNNRFIRLFNRLLLFVYTRTDGRIGSRLGRWNALMLTTTGRKSGFARTTPLVYMADGNRLIIVASNNGGTGMPAWYLNLATTPCVLVRHGRTQGYFRARTATPAERQALWPRLVAYHPPYADHQKHTPREIPVVILDPADS